LPIVDRHLLGRTLATAEMTTKRTLRKSASEEGLGTALARKTSGPELYRLVIRPDSFGGRGGHAKVEAWVGATRSEKTTHFISEGVASSKGLAMNPNGRGRFGGESPDGAVCGRDVPLMVQVPVAGVGDVGRGNDDEKMNIASLSLGSDTEYLAKTYVIVDPKVEQNVSLTMEILLELEITKAVTSVLDEQFVERRVFFSTFTRYFLAKERSFQIMMGDLLRHRETSHNDEPPLVHKDDVPRLRHIANKRMGYLRAMYRLFKDKVSETEQDNISLMKLRMKMCITQYHALIPQLDLIATQWGVSIEDTLSHNNFGSPKSGKKDQRRQSKQEEQLHNKAKKPRGQMVMEDTEDTDRA
jgi:hypothetical protein